MANGTSGSRISAVLAALDNDTNPNSPNFNSLFSTLTAGSGSKRKSPPNPAAGPSGKRRKATKADRLKALAEAGVSPALLSNTQAGLPTHHAQEFGINYDVETPLSNIDIGGPDQVERMAEFVTKSIDNASNGVTVKDAIEYLKLTSKQDYMPGMEVRLLPHQIIGCAWMLQQEREKRFKGGVLADEMGLGKTVQMICTMAANMPPPNSDRKTTLVVVPAALLQQWKEEIESKTNGIFDVHIHHGKDKLKTLDDMESKDIIITTYQTLNNDFSVPKGTPLEEEDEWIQDNGGLISQMRFYRVVLDEAQFIRNRSTRSSKSVARLDSYLRWMLTGTPVTNTLADIYGLLRFGKFRPYNDWNDFNSWIAKVQLEDAPLAGMRAQAILKPLLLRRTKDGTLEGEPLLKLPSKTIKLDTLEFSSDERELYDQFEKRAKIRINKFIRERSIIKNHAAVLVMILRLRQLCCHPFLILSLTDGEEDPTLAVAGDSEKELARAVKVMGYPWVNEVKQRFMGRARAAELDFDDENDDLDASCPACNDILLRDSGRVLSCGHEVCFDCIMEIRGSPISHNGIFGNGDEKENARIEKEYETAAAKGWRPCPSCKKMVDLTQDKIFKSAAFEPSQEDMYKVRRAQEKKKLGPPSSPIRAFSTARKIKTIDDIGNLSDSSSDDDLPDVKSLLDVVDQKPKFGKAARRIDDSDDEVIARSTKKGAVSDSDTDMDEEPQSLIKDKGKGKSSNKKTADKPSAQLVATWNKGDDTMEPSTKMMALIELLKSWNATGDKCICYSQWTSMLDLVEKLFYRYGIQHLRYDGKMNKEERETALSIFKKAGGPKVMLISTKCGSVGLNLVSANRCINMDLSWNYSTENQAFDRLHRIGQEKEVYVHRLIVRNTIEERMLRLQDTKVGLAEAALGEGTGIKLHKLSVKELKTLFGMGGNQNQQNDNPREL